MKVSTVLAFASLITSSAAADAQAVQQQKPLKGIAEVTLYDDIYFQGQKKTEQLELEPNETGCRDLTDFKNKAVSAEWLIPTVFNADVCFWDELGCKGTPKCYYSGHISADDLEKHARLVSSFSVTRRN